MNKENTFVIPLIRDDLIETCLEKLYLYTPPNFYVFLIDQTIHGVDATKLRNKYRNLMVIRTPKSDVHWTGNLGFAQATNLGIRLAQTPYITMWNDDVQAIFPAWWDGVMDTFKMVAKATPTTPAIIVNPASTRLADWSVGRASGDDFDIIPYKDKYTEEDWRHLTQDDLYVNEHLTIKPKSVIDGVTMYASVIDVQKFLEVGYLDERYYPGAGEDYDYSCRARMFGYRCVGTTLSWVFHAWSSTFKDIRDKEEIRELVIPELSWNGNHDKWGKGFDIWGYRCPKCTEIMETSDGIKATCPKDGEIYNMPLSTTAPL